MFDDQPISPSLSSVPNNLPLGEPQDIFEGTDTAMSMPAPSLDTLQEVQPAAAATALNAGILKPKTPIQEEAPTYMTPPVMGDENAIKEPKLSRGIMIAIMTLLVVFILAGAGWFVYNMFTKKTVFVPLEKTPAPISTPEPVSDLPVTLPSLESNQATSSDAVDREIIVGESPDSDGDGLKDDREKELGTDPANWDTDKDDLSDGEEVLIWHTDPKNSDTDADTYKDGAEIKSGYNPSGPGRLSERSSPSSTPVSATTSTNFANTTTSFGVQPVSSTKSEATSTLFQIEL